MTLQLSENTKCRRSVNLSRRSCKPTKLCRKACYGLFRTKEDGKDLSLPANCGPITWPTQQEAYERNLQWLEQASRQEILLRGKRMGAALRRRGAWELRFCGMGDLVPGLLVLAEALLAEGIKPWGFSKKPEMIRQMPKGSSMIGSVDESMPRGRIERLISATQELLDKPALAYMTMNPGWVGAQEVESLWYRKHLTVVFGFHTSCHRTVVDHPLACAATNGVEDVHCPTCARCITPVSL